MRPTQGAQHDDLREPTPAIDRSRMSAQEKHEIAMLLADLIMADLKRRPPKLDE